MTHLFAALLTTFLAVCGSASASTVVPGGALGNTTWTLTGSPYIVQGDVTISAGATLTVEAGVEVRTASTDASASGLDINRVEITVLGTLDVQGDAADPVRFVPDASTSSSAWYGIVVDAAGVATFLDAEIERSSYGIRSAGSLTADGLSVSLGATSGVYVTAGAASIARGTFTSSSYGIYASGSGTLDVTSSAVWDTTSHGIYLYPSSGSTTTVDRVTVYSASGSGLYVTLASGTPTVTVTNSVLTDNLGYGVYGWSSTITSVSNTDAWNNGSGNLSGVSQGAGILAENPLFVSAPTDFALTSNSPCRFGADDGTDLGYAPYAGAATPGLYGTLWVDTALGSGVHAMAGDLTVADGVTLTLNPGAILEAATTDLMKAHLDTNRVELRVAGTLFGLGAATNQVQFRSTGTSSTSWYGIHLLATANTGVIHDARIEEATYGIRSDALANNPVRDSVFERNGTAGVYVTTGELLLEGLEIRDSSYGVYGSGTVVLDILDTLVEDTTSHGMYFYPSTGSDIHVDHATVWSCSGSGMYVTLASGTPTVDVTNSIVTDNLGYGIYGWSSTITSTSFVDAWNNGSGNLSGVSQLGGILAENPLFAAAGTDFALTEWSPARFAAADGTDLGAYPFAGAPTVGLQGTLWGGLVLDAAGSPYSLVGDVTVPLGDTLTVEPGVVVQAATTDTMKAHLDTNRVELRIEGTLDAAGTPYEPVVFDSTGTSSTSWYGIHLLATATGAVSNALVAEATYGVRHSATGNVPLTYVTFERNGTAGAYIDAGSPVLDGISATGSSYGVYMSGSGNLTLTNGLVFDTTSHGVYLYPSGSAAITLMNCTFHSNSGSGVYVTLASGTPTVAVTNTLSTSNLGYGVYGWSSTITTVSYTDGWNNGSGNLSGVSQGAGILATNPFYVDEPARNLRLGGTSPAIDAGTAVGAPDHDLADRPRPVDGNLLGGAQYDLGAYEYRIEVPGITVTPAGSIVVAETGTTRTLDVVLDTAPLADVTLNVTASDTTEATAAPAQLLFTPANWSTPQSIVVTGVDDDVDDGEPAWSLTLDPGASVDLDYQVVTATVISGATSDDDTASIVLANASGKFTTESGGADSFTVVLGSQPANDVRVDLVSLDTTEGTVSPPAVTFTAANWATPRTITVTGVDDASTDGDVVWQVQVDPALAIDPVYAALPAQTVDVTNGDDESQAPGITVIGTSLATTEAGGQSSATVVLDAAPTASVTIPVSCSPATEASPSTASLVFTVANWNTPQVVTVTGEDDAVDDGDQVFTLVLGVAVSADAAYAGLDPDDVAGSNADDDTAGFVVTASDPRTTEAGGSDVVLVHLTSAPTSNVTLTPSSSNTAEGTVSGAITFDAANYATDRAVVVTGVDDLAIDGDQAYAVTFTVGTSDAVYAALTVPDVAVVNADDDLPSILVEGAPVVTDEGGGVDTFTVRLGGRPTADVIVPLTVDDPTEATLSTAQLVFTQADFGVPQVVTVTGVDDPDADGLTAYVVSVGPASSTDPAYDGLSASAVDGTNRDDETASVVFTPDAGLEVDEEGAEAEFTVVLTLAPTDDVTLTLAIDDATEASLDPVELTFTPLDWNTPQTVVITGEDDTLTDGDVPWQVTLADAVSNDPAYDAADLGDPTVDGVTHDDDGPGYTIVPATGLATTEGGGTATFTVSLRTAPAADVFVVANSTDPGEGSAAPAVLTFTAATWATPQIVTVTGEDDVEVDGDVAYAIALSVTTSDAAYADLDPDDVDVVNLDDDQPAGETGDTGTGPTTDGVTDGGTTDDTDTVDDTGSGTGTDTPRDPANEGSAPVDKGGCGCASPGSPAGAAPIAPVAAVLVALTLRRRRQ